MKGQRVTTLSPIGLKYCLLVSDLKACLSITGSLRTRSGRRQVQLCLFRLVYIVGLALRLVAGTYDLVFEDELADEALRVYDFGAWYLASCSTIVWTRRGYLIDWLIVRALLQ
jgi:hypothetical protein